MARIVVILFLASGLGFIVGNIQSAWKPSVEDRFYLAAGMDTASKTENKSVETAPENSGQPAIEFPEGTMFKFETMKHGTSLSHDFPVKNIGTAPLKIEKAGSTCKCTVPKLEEGLLMPGQTTLITLEWRGVAVSSNFGQTATFKTNAVEKPEFNLQIQGAVIDSFVLDPDQVNLGTFASDTGTSREFSVFCYADGVDVGSVEWSNAETSKFFKLSKTEFSPATTEGHTKALKAYKVQIEVLPGLPVGVTSGKVLLVTNQDESVEKIELKVTGNSVSEISLIGGSAFKPESNILSIGNLTTKDEFSTTLWLVLRGQGHESMEVAIDQKDGKESLNVSLGERKIEANRTVIPINFEVPKGAKEVYYPGVGKGTYAEVVVRATSSKTVELPIFVKLTIAK